MGSNRQRKYLYQIVLAVLYFPPQPLATNPQCLADTLASDRSEQRALANELRRIGHTYVEVAGALRRQFNVNLLVAFRLAHGWSQQQAADRWSRQWPDDPKTAKNISYWELWPSRTGHAPSLEVIDRLARLYQCSVSDLLADRGDYRLLDEAGRGRPGTAPAPTPVVSSREAPQGWYVKSLVTLLKLDLETPTALEDRTIVAARDGLDEIATSMSVPRPAEDTRGSHGLEVRLLSGGSLVLRDHPHESQFRHVIALPRALRAGEAHEYRLSIRIPAGQLMSNHSVQIPLQRSDCYKLTVRFSMNRLPTGVWLLDGVPPAVLGDRELTARTLRPDKFGEVSVTFTDLLQGQAYGLRWSF